MDGAASGGRRQVSPLPVRALVGIAAVVAAPTLASAQPGSAMALFQERFVTCPLGTPPPDSRARSLEALRNLSPETILVSMTTGPMAPNTTGLTDPQRRARPQGLRGGRALRRDTNTA